jgi:PST family polysaccharide transporter
VGLSFLITLSVIRYLGPDRYGMYLMVWSALMLVDITMEASVFAIAVREIAKANERASEWLGALTAVCGSIGILVSTGLLMVPLFIELGEEWAAAVRMGSLVFLIGTFRTPVTYYRALLMVHWELGLRVLAYAIELGLVLLLTQMGGGVGGLMGAKAVATGLFVVPLWLATLWRFRVRPQGGLGLIRPLTLLSIPLGVTAVLVLLQIKGDILLIGWVIGPKGAGVFGALALVTELAFVASNVLATTTEPLLAQSLGKGDGGHFQSVFQLLFNILVGFLPGAAVVSCLLAGPVVRVGLGNDYAAFLPEFRVLVWVAMLIPISQLMGSTAVTLNLQSKLVKVELISVIITVSANVILLNVMGILAAAWIRLGVYAIAVIWTYAIIRAHSGYRLSLKQLRPLAAAAGVALAVMGTMLWAHPLVTAVLGTLSYVAAIKVPDIIRGARDWLSRPEGKKRTLPHAEKGIAP